MNALLVTVPLAPMVAALLAGLVGRRFRPGAGLIATAGIALSLIALLRLRGTEAAVSSSWIQTGNLLVTVGLKLDGLAWLMAMIVATVGLLVTLYSMEYMEGGLPRYFSVSSFFLGAMLTLVLSDSLLLLFAAWEGVGLASFLLIGFWYQEKTSRHAAQKAFLVTRAADMGFLLAFLLVLNWLGSTEIGTLLTTVKSGGVPAIGLTWLALCFFVAAIGKSAQLPFTAWLPDAMAGPTPVSALIHSATMLAAGVYLILRLFPLFEAAPKMLEVVLWVGGVTALLAALLATMQNDIKRLLAWSTVSQLGEMMLALGLGGALAASFHLATHAMFKSTLFLAAGSISHCSGSRDLWKLGKLRLAIPITTFVFVAAAFALAGVPPFSGFWSEEEILADAAHAGLIPAVLMVVLIFLAGVYISRAAAAAFTAWPEAPSPPACDPRKWMAVPMLLLAAAALGTGFFLKGHLEQLLPFSSPPKLAWGWRGLAIAGSLAGLAFGAYRVRVRGPVPAFGSFPQFISQTLDKTTQLPARVAFSFSVTVRNIDGAFDELVNRLAQTTKSIVLAAAKLETVLDTLARMLTQLVRDLGVAIQHSEQHLDSASQAAGQSTMILARETGLLEESGLSLTMDRFASGFGLTGGLLRRLQTGKIYLYTLTLFVWVMLSGILIGVAWWF